MCNNVLWVFLDVLIPGFILGVSTPCLLLFMRRKWIPLHLHLADALIQSDLQKVQGHSPPRQVE